MKELDAAKKLKEIIIDEAAIASTVVKRNASGDINVRLTRQNYQDEQVMGGGLVFRNNATSDNYLRVCSNPAAIKTWLGAADATHNHDANYVKLNETITIPTGKRIDLKNNVPIFGWGKNSGAPYNLLVLNNLDQVQVGEVDLPMTLRSKDTIKATIKTGSNTYEYDIYHTGNKPTPADIGASTSNHNHDSVYSALSHNHNSLYSALSHNHDSIYLKLTGGIINGRTTGIYNTGTTIDGTLYNKLALESKSTDGGPAGIGFHRQGSTAISLYTLGNEPKNILRVRTSANADYDLYHAGNKPTPAELNVYTKDEVNNASNYNIVKNGGFKKGLVGWWKGEYNPNGTGRNITVVTDASEWVLDGKNALVLQSTNNTAGEFRADSQKFKVKKNTNYTISYLVAAHRITEMGHYIRGTEWEIIDSVVYYPLAGGKNPKDWTRISRTFNTGEHAQISINFCHFKTQNDAYSWITDVTINEGNIPMQYMPNPNELLTENISADDYGFTVKSFGTFGNITNPVSYLESASLTFKNTAYGSENVSYVGMLNNSLELNSKSIYLYTNGGGVNVSEMFSVMGPAGCSITSDGLNSNKDYAFNMGNTFKLGYISCQSLVQMSDRKLKENIKYINNNEDKITPNDFYNFFLNEFQPVSFKFKNRKDDATELGFIAQDIQESKISNYIIIEKENSDLSFSNNSFTSSIAIALQEAIKKIETLEARIKEIENK